MISVVIPAYNEESGIGDLLGELLSLSEEVTEIEEIIVVDDGSNDKTPTIAREYDVQVIEHQENIGYGASLKTGIRSATEEYILITDADGTYPVASIPELINYVGKFDMVVGARKGENVNIPVYRQPAKWFLSALANYLVDSTIPDLNSGLRIFRKEDVEELFHILPSGFSFTTTITLSYHTSNMFVKYIPINYHNREGNSKINPLRDGMNFILLILRTVTYFKPLRVYLPVGTTFLFLSLVVYIYTELFLDAFYDTTTVILAVFGIHFLMYGLLADLIVRQHKS